MCISIDLVGVHCLLVLLLVLSLYDVAALCLFIVVFMYTSIVCLCLSCATSIDLFLYVPLVVVGDGFVSDLLSLLGC